MYISSSCSSYIIRIYVCTHALDCTHIWYVLLVSCNTIEVVATLHGVRSAIDYDGVPDTCNANILLQVGGMAKLAQTF